MTVDKLGYAEIMQGKKVIRRRVENVQLHKTNMGATYATFDVCSDWDTLGEGSAILVNGVWNVNHYIDCRRLNLGVIEETTRRLNKNEYPVIVELFNLCEV